MYDWVLHDEAVAGSVTYQGYTHANKTGQFMFVKIDETSDTVVRYCFKQKSEDTYANHWTGRAALTYGMYDQYLY